MDEDDASICEQKPSDIPVPREQKRWINGTRSTIGS
jgi:hypothetical protein